MKKLAAGMCAALLLCLLAGCGNKTQQIGSSTAMDLADFNVYTGGQIALTLEETEDNSILFAWADAYDLEAGKVETRRGIAIGDSDYEIVKQYGDIMCQIDFKRNNMWETAYDTTYTDYYGSGLYCKEYNVTFYAFVRGGRLRSPGEEETFISLDTSANVEIYGLTFTVEGGVIRNIESYAYQVQ